jgi:hypothetical protein
MIMPSRTTKFGVAVPAYQVDEKFAKVVSFYGWAAAGRGYLCAWVGGRREYLHRFVFFLEHGWHPKSIDHENRDKLDCRLENLRPASGRLQNLNRNRRKSTGLPPGVHRFSDYSRKKPFWSKIHVGGKSRYLGAFCTPEEASNAYEQARSEQVAREDSHAN